MYYNVVFYDQGSKNSYGVGVYATTEESARAVGAVLLNRQNGLSLTPAQVQLEQLRDFESNVPTTT